MYVCMHGSHVLVLRCSGIGPKRGVELIQQYKSIDEILKHKSKLPSVSVAVQLQHGTPTLPPIPCSTHCHHPPIPCPSLHPHLPPLPLMPPSPPTPAPHATLTSHTLLHILLSSSIPSPSRHPYHLSSTPHTTLTSHPLLYTPPSPPTPAPHTTPSLFLLWFVVHRMFSSLTTGPMRRQGSFL